MKSHVQVVLQADTMTVCRHSKDKGRGMSQGLWKLT